MSNFRSKWSHSNPNLTHPRASSSMESLSLRQGILRFFWRIPPGHLAHYALCWKAGAFQDEETLLMSPCFVSLVVELDMLDEDSPTNCTHWTSFVLCSGRPSHGGQERSCAPRFRGSSDDFSALFATLLNPFDSFVRILLAVKQLKHVKTIQGNPLQSIQYIVPGYTFFIFFYQFVSSSLIQIDL